MSDTVHKSEFQELAKDVREIKAALLGNKEFGQKGYLDRLEVVEEDVEALIDFKKKVVYYSAGGAAGATAAVQFIFSML